MSRTRWEESTLLAQEMARMAITQVHNVDNMVETVFDFACQVHARYGCEPEQQCQPGAGSRI